MTLNVENDPYYNLEFQDVLKQENAEQILFHRRIKPDGTKIFESYMALRIARRRLLEKLHIGVYDDSIQYYNDLLTLQSLEDGIEVIEQDLLKPLTPLQAVISSGPFKILKDGGMSAVEFIVDILQGIPEEIKPRGLPENPQNLGTRRYVWRTQRDGKVRPDHAVREGLVFEWNNPPFGGNPQTSHGCRCWAEPLPDDWEAGLGKVDHK